MCIIHKQKSQENSISCLFKTENYIRSKKIIIQKNTLLFTERLIRFMRVIFASPLKHNLHETEVHR